MDPSLTEVWKTAPGSPFAPTIGKDNQFYVGFSFLLLAIALSGSFLLKPSFISVPVLGVPASLSFAIGVVYMFCAVGVYV